MLSYTLHWQNILSKATQDLIGAKATCHQNLRALFANKRVFRFVRVYITLLGKN